MPRPTPIIIPGQSGMGGSWKRSETNLQLDKIAELAKFIMGMRAAQQEEPARKETANLLTTIAGLSKGETIQPSSVQYIPQDTQVGGVAKSMPVTDEQPQAGGSYDPMAGFQPAYAHSIPMTPVQTPDFRKLADTKEGTDVLKSIAIAKATADASGKGSDFKTATIEKTGEDGKIHYYSMDPKTGMFSVDQGTKPKEEFKVMRPIGRGGNSGRAIIQDPNSGAMYYQDSVLGGEKEQVPPEDALYIRPVTVRGIEGAQAVELANLKDTYNRLGDIATKAEKLQDKFGPVSGRWTKLKQKFVEEGATQEVMNEMRSLITIAYGLSGKQISKEEMVMIQEAILPTMEQPYLNFASTLNFAKNWVANTHDQRIDYYKNSFFDVAIPYIKDKKERGSYATKSNSGGGVSGVQSGRHKIERVED